ncbi:MAG: ABC transporter ATP-binding protein [Lachnospiraceae bacterium]|nr:ABC transporter ATP-binding protein [Lachnospiraceae bacterium]
MNPLLELNNVSYAYHSKSGETNALSDISFQVYPGEFIAVVGPSGCGKSTLLSLISGLLLPESGSILFNGQTETPVQARTVSGISRRRLPSDCQIEEKKRLDKNGIGYMLQRDHLFEWRTIYQNIMLGLEIQRKLDDQSRKRVDQMLRDYHLDSFRNMKPSELSGGMRQRAALIRTLAPDPKLFLLDEPFSALDFQTRLSVCDDVAAILRREKKTALLVTHDLSEAVSMSSRVIVLTKRPAHIRSILEMKFAQEELTPFERRNAPEFKDYFNLLWKELNAHESYNDKSYAKQQHSHG